MVRDHCRHSRSVYSTLHAGTYDDAVLRQGQRQLNWAQGPGDFADGPRRMLWPSNRKTFSIEAGGNDDEGTFELRSLGLLSNSLREPGTEWGSGGVT